MMLKIKLKKFLLQYPELFSFIKAPLNWIYCAFLTIRYADEYNTFPAFKINGSANIRIKKSKGSKICINGKLIFEQWLNGEETIAVTLTERAKLNVNNDFTLGNGVKLYLGPDSNAVLKGKLIESASGITANAVVMVHNYLEIGCDCIIAWNTFITDCDWHGIDGKKAFAPTIIGDHVWIGVGAKILKGVNLRANTIVSANSVVVAKPFPEKCLIGGMPATVLKSDIEMWHREMKSVISIND